MSLTPSTMLALGTPAPDFSLPDTGLNIVNRTDYRGKPLLVAFMCNHCPYVKHLADALVAFSREYEQKGLATVAINANDIERYPDDAPKKMAEEVDRRGYAFAYLFDETQDVAKAYTAACTPDFFLFDAEHKLAYRGQFDDTRPARIASGVYDSSAARPTGAALRAAADAVLSGRPAPADQKPSMGCNIKWKPGNEPTYFEN